MPDPILIQFVQVADGAVDSAAVCIQGTFQNPINQMYHFPEYARCHPMIAVAADHGLKTGR